MYVSQLLPDLEQARVLRAALVNYANSDITEHERDLAWSMLAKLTDDMRKRGVDAKPT